MENLWWAKIPDPDFETTLLSFSSLLIGLLMLEDQNKLEFKWFLIAKSVAWEVKDLLEWEKSGKDLRKRLVLVDEKM